MKHVLLIVFVILSTVNAVAQSYTSYLTGSPQDLQSLPLGGICLMGGATEDDQAMKWFLQRASGGDVLVLRTTGTNGYNNYFYSQLGISLNSVETIVCHNTAAADDPYVLQRIAQAEAIWFAGGNQWTYISQWRDTPLNNAINDAIEQRNVAIGGTSAGMAIQGQYYFSAQSGTVTSSSALSNPYSQAVTVDHSPFIVNPFLEQVITDTHFDNPDRRGRLATFLARIYTDSGVSARAIACDEYTAVCIEPDGAARVFGGAPTYQDFAYFVQTNCELTEHGPEVCIPSTPLTWNRSGEALKVYRINGNASGSVYFDLNTWNDGIGGEWLHWYVDQGAFNQQGGDALQCETVAISEQAMQHQWNVFPNPTAGILWLSSDSAKSATYLVNVYDVMGQLMHTEHFNHSRNLDSIQLNHLPDGIYMMVILDDLRHPFYQRVMKGSSVK